MNIPDGRALCIVSAMQEISMIANTNIRGFIGIASSIIEIKTERLEISNYINRKLNRGFINRGFRIDLEMCEHESNAISLAG